MEMYNNDVWLFNRHVFAGICCVEHLLVCISHECSWVCWDMMKVAAWIGAPSYHSLMVELKVCAHAYMRDVCLYSVMSSHRMLPTVVYWYFCLKTFWSICKCTCIISTSCGPLNIHMYNYVHGNVHVSYAVVSLRVRL